MDLFAAHERSNPSTSPLDGNDPLRDAGRDISLTQISYYVGTTPLAERLPVFELPLADRRWFWGRQDLLDKLEKAWRSHATVTLTQTLAGMGGVGKSQLAAQFAYRHRGELDVVWWVSCTPAARTPEDPGLVLMVKTSEGPRQ